MRTFDGVLFDLDGVLIDSTEGIVALWHGLTAAHGRRLHAADIDRHVLGCSPEHTVATLFAGLPPHVHRDVLAAVREAEPDLAFVEIAGAGRLVRELHAAGIRLGLVTGASGARAERVLTTLGLHTRFEARVTWGEAERGKPAPDCYELAVRRLGLRPEACLVFEDAPGGVSAAVAAGTACVGVGPAATGAKWRVAGLNEVGCRPYGTGVALELAGKPVAALARSVGVR